MSAINILDKSIYNRIAAGEVVERPLSIVKELIENSIDAEATAISIDIAGGGLKRIYVADNGKGILPEDVPTAFLAHATSKINSVADLDSISSLGFRGEALPSIAAVAKIKMNTRPNGNIIGFTYTVDNGEVVDSGECGCPFGTSVTVTELFEKIPARKKFLEKSSTEEAAITSTVARLILANNTVSIKYSVDGQVVFHSAGTGIENAIFTVYGKDFYDGLLKIDSINEDIKLSGYICKPSASKHTKNYQTLIVNGRYVKDDSVSYWVYGCYQNYLMKRQYPSYILYIDLPFDLVDINVHPNKLQIRFANENLIKKIITDAVKKEITKCLELPTAITVSDQINPDAEFPEPIPVDVPTNLAFDSSILGEIRTQKIITHKDDVLDLHDSASKQIDLQKIKETVAGISDPDMSSGDPDEFIKSVHRELQNNFAHKNEANDNLHDNQNSFLQEEILLQQCEISQKKEARYCGKLFNTYLIYEYDDDVFLIDQHAAHERILFDKLKAAYENNMVVVQNLLIPYTFSVSPEEGIRLMEVLPLLDRMGFHMEVYDNNSFSLKSVPTECSEIAIDNFLGNIIDNVLKGSSLSKADIISDKLAQSACKAAIKAGMDIPRAEIDDLIEQMLVDGRILVCPHGRPIIITFNKTDIEKCFKRIV